MLNSSTDSSSAETGADAKRFAVDVGIGVALTLLIAEILLRLFVVPLEQGWAHRVDLVYRAVGTDVVLGDSHTFRGFVTRDDFVNLSGGGSSTMANEIVAREYFRHREPGRVIVGASPQLFNRARERSGTQQHDEYFTQNFGLPFRLYIFEPGVARQIGELRDPLGLVARVREAHVRKQPANAFDAVLQYEMLQLEPDARDELAGKIVRKNRPLEDIRASESFAAYRRMLAFLIDRGADVCLVRTAVSPRVRALTAEDERFVDAHRALRDLAAELGTRYVDYRDLGIDFQDELFIDPDHLTATGGDFFAEAVIRSCFGEAR